MTPEAEPNAERVPTTPRARHGWRDSALALLGFVCLSALAHLELLESFLTQVPRNGDSLQVMWTLWWVREAFLGHGALFFADRIYYPWGASLAFHSLTLSNSIPALAVWPILGSVGTLNFFILLAPALCGHSVYLIVRYLSSSRWAAAFAGTVFMFCAYLQGHQQAGQIDLIGLQGLGYLAYGLLLTAESPSRRNVLLSGLALTYAAYLSWYFLVFGGLLTTLLLAGRRNGAGVLIVAIAAMLSLPGIVPLTREDSSQALSFGARQQHAHFAANLAAYALPRRHHPLFRDRVGPLYSRMNAADTPEEQMVSPGVVAMILAATALALRRGWPMGRLAGIAGVFFVLSLGPILRFLDWSFPLEVSPFETLLSIPGLEVLRSPARFSGVVALMTAILAGLGFAELIKRRWYLLTAVLAGVALVEVLPNPFWLMPPPPAELFRFLEKGDRRAFLNLPLHLGRNADGMYEQTLHERAIVGGYLSRTPRVDQSWLSRSSVSWKLIEWKLLGEPPADSVIFAGLARTLRSVGVGFVVLRCPNSSEPAALKLLETELSHVLGARLRSAIGDANVLELSRGPREAPELSLKDLEGERQASGEWEAELAPWLKRLAADLESGRPDRMLTPEIRNNLRELTRQAGPILAARAVRVEVYRGPWAWVELELDTRQGGTRKAYLTARRNGLIWEGCRLHLTESWTWN